MNVFLFLWFGVFLAVFPALGEENESRTLSPYFFVEGGDSGVDSLPLKKTEADVRITGVIADVTVTQVYSNSGNNPLNARYVFPASTRAAVQGMTMTVGDRVVKAKIRERETARKEFDQAKKEGKSASLLNQERPNVFTMSVANIMPGDTVAIELHYTELLVPEKGIYEFVYPAVVGPRYSGKPAGDGNDPSWIENPFLRKNSNVKTGFDIRCRLSAGMPLQDVACTSYDTTVAFDGPSSARVLLKDPMNTAGNRDYILRYRLADRKIQSGLMLYRGEKENFFLLTVQPPERAESGDIPPREYVFVVDVSGSMEGFPLDVSKDVLKKLIGSLKPTDKFNVVLFAGTSSVMAPSSVLATPENIERGLNHITSQRGGGGTELAAAMKTAFGIPRDPAFSRSVIVVTDGYIAEEKEIFDLIGGNLSKTNVFAFGIGSSVNRYLIEGIARAGLGEPFVVTKEAEAEGAAARFCEYVKTPLLKDIRVDYRGFDVYDLEPAAIPDMFGERPVVVAGKWKGNAAGTIRVTGTGGKDLYVQDFKVEDFIPLTENKPLASLWARTRVARLSDLQIGRGEDDSKAEITALGLNYSLLTKYTSFIAVHEKVRNPGGTAKDVKQPLPLPQGVSELAVGDSMTQVPEPGFWLMFALAGLGMAFMGKWRVRGHENG